ncbi:MAG TPA: TAXI family TRAP transporter solute-binding subunit [Dehalococcoidia bacterium]|nr:TAXI family TRAP transporter solute-binding subunit [Dehalococcoidia bacterium]
MKRHFIKLMTGIILMVIVGALVFTGCAEEEEPPPPPPPPVEEEEEPPPPPPPPEEVWEWPDKMNILSIGPTGSAYGATVAWTAQLQKETGMTIRQVSVENQRERYRHMKEGLFFTTPERFPDSLIRAEGEGFGRRDEGPWPQRIIWPVGVANSGYVVRGDSEVNTPYDLKGKKVAFFVWDPTKTSMKALLAWGNVSEDEVEWVPVSGIQASQTLIMEGRADTVFAFPNNPVWFEAEAAPNGIKWLELNSETDREGAERYLEVRPGYLFGPCIAGTPSSLDKWMLTSVAAYVTRSDTDTDLVYNVVKWLDENHDLYKDAHPWAKQMTREYLMELAETDFVPLHDGAVKYLEEQGEWTPAHEARRQQNIDLFTNWSEAWETAVDMADEQGIAVDPANEDWVSFWAEQSASTGLPPFQYFLGLD